eukprot:5206730-Prymnesium_polylepis.2
MDVVGRAVCRRKFAPHVLLAPRSEVRILAAERSVGVELGVEQPAAVGRELDQHLLGEVAHLRRIVEAHAELAALARQPAHWLGEDVEPECVGTKRRRQLVAAERVEKKLLERVARARHHQALDEFEDDLPVGVDGHGALESHILPISLRAEQLRRADRRERELQPRLKFLALALRIRAALVQLLVHSTNQVDHVGRHAVERGEFRQAVLQLILQRVCLLLEHRIDDNVA